MKKFLAVLSLFGCITAGRAQSAYIDSMTKYVEEYVKKHEVITGDDKKYFRFYPVSETYRVKARVEKVNDGKWFSMETSGAMKQVFRVFATVHFVIRDTALTLSLYQSQMMMGVAEYKDYLFLPFTDLSSGEDTYANGRYIDLQLTDISNNEVIIDFNKAYNPYCAYANNKYNCPIPPRENYLPVVIAAGEKNFAKAAAASH